MHAYDTFVGNSSRFFHVLQGGDFGGENNASRFVAFCCDDNGATALSSCVLC